MGVMSKNSLGKQHQGSKTLRNIALGLSPLMFAALLSPGIASATPGVLSDSIVITSDDDTQDEIQAEKKPMVLGMKLYKKYQINTDDHEPVYSIQIPPRVLTQVKNNGFHSPVLVEYAALEKHDSQGHVDYYLRKSEYDGGALSHGGKSTPQRFEEVHIGEMVYRMITAPENKDFVDPQNVFDSLK